MNKTQKQYLIITFFIFIFFAIIIVYTKQNKTNSETLPNLIKNKICTFDNYHSKNLKKISGKIKIHQKLLETEDLKTSYGGISCLINKKDNSFVMFIPKNKNLSLDLLKNNKYFATTTILKDSKKDNNVEISFKTTAYDLLQSNFVPNINNLDHEFFSIIKKNKQANILSIVILDEYLKNNNLSLNDIVSSNKYTKSFLKAKKDIKEDIMKYIKNN